MNQTETEPIEAVPPVTLAHYWAKLTKDDREFLLDTLNFGREPQLHMGTLPFVPAGEVYLKIYKRYPKTNDEVIYTSKILSTLSPHNMVLADHYPRRFMWGTITE